MLVKRDQAGIEYCVACGHKFCVTVLDDVRSTEKSPQRFPALVPNKSGGLNEKRFKSEIRIQVGPPGVILAGCNGRAKVCTDSLHQFQEWGYRTRVVE